MRFQSGDIVKIAKNSGFYSGSDSDPKDLNGTVERNSESPFGIRVKWDNGYRNQYREHDLRLVKRN